MRQYEVVYILDPGLDDAQQSTLIERFRGIVGTQGGDVQHVDRWERRRLAYEISGRREGYYVVMHFTGEPVVQAELSRVLGITEGILRHMIVKLDPKRAEKAIADAKAAAEAKAKAEAEARAAAAAAQAAAEAAAAAAEAANAANAQTDEAGSTDSGTE